MVTLGFTHRPIFKLLHRNKADVLNCCPLQLNSLQTENSSLQWQAPRGSQHPPDPSGHPPVHGGRPMSMYETGSGMRQYPHRGDPPRRDDGLAIQPLPTNVSTETTHTAPSWTVLWQSQWTGAVSSFGLR